MQICLPQNIRKIIETLENSGFEAYVVGGSVRDSPLNKTPTDFDVCTSALPEDITALFKNTVPTGIKHGTVTVISDGSEVEVTTFRTDGEYKDFRHPDKVRFVKNLKDDLSRRDFTVNAMCYNEKSGIIDYFGGLDDLKNKILRAVGNPDKRFKEDALRIIRLFRFAANIGFDIENKTYLAAIKNAGLLKNVSAERIREELIKLSCGEHPEAVSPLLKTNALELFSQNNELSKVSLLPQKKHLRFFAFLKLTSKDFNESLCYLKCSTAFKLYAEKMSLSIEKEIKNSADIKRVLSVLEDDIFDLFSYKSTILNEDTAEQKSEALRIITSGEPYKLTHLAVSGDDIIKAGYTGAQVGKKLQKLLELVIENPFLNKKDILLSNI